MALALLICGALLAVASTAAFSVPAAGILAGFLAMAAGVDLTRRP